LHHSKRSLRRPRRPSAVCLPPWYLLPCCLSHPYMLNTRNAEKKSRFRFVFSLLDGCSNLEYGRIYVIFRVTQAEYDICILMAASQDYVNTYSTRRVSPRGVSPSCITAKEVCGGQDGQDGCGGGGGGTLRRGQGHRSSGCDQGHSFDPCGKLLTLD